MKTGPKKLWRTDFAPSDLAAMGNVALNHVSNLMADLTMAELAISASTRTPGR